MLGLLGALALAWAFHVYARVLPSAALAALWGVFACLIAAALFRQARVRRGAFLAVYFAAASPLQSWLRGGVFMALGSLAVGGILALVLMTSLARIEGPWQWLALLAAVPAIVLLRASLWRPLARHASPHHMAVLSWRVAALVTGAALVAGFVLLALHQAYPAFADVSLERAVWHMIDQEQARSAPWQGLLEARAGLDGLRLWLAQQLMPAPGDSFLQMLGWVLVFAEETLFVWSYLLMGYGVLQGIGAHDRAWY
ncbi:MAG: hypothetical protein ACNA8J_07525 [Gammaproteobacteria bacterium]